VPVARAVPGGQAMKRSLRYLLLQVRNVDDPMRQHEVEAFARVLEVAPEAVGVFDLLNVPLGRSDLASVDMLLLGGSGDYSAVEGGAWLDRALDSLRLVHDVGKPTFASCWGFQAMARALGGRLVKDRDRAEVGTHRVYLTEAGRADPVFAPLAPSFLGQMGHEDHVVGLPPRTTWLAHSDKVRYQAYRFDDAPIYCTQFHPELTTDDLLIRLGGYPEYVEKIARTSLEQIREGLRDTTPSEGILKRFVALHFP
jgi:GMP synthase (glutamine-hydrolysing)